ncbi:MAG TPA: PqqD family peptide modification chaperone [Armatimonadota bacterium]|mgnify:CR=1 FL=1|nr:PqqD family peptide modification chaperone [Armatimonadota bacterium]HQK92008.1 PqqD family peptide modification chaperone [Armatimonadota bacterium]
MIGVDSHLRPKPDVIVTDLDDEAVLLDMEAKRYFGLNDTGLVVWRTVAQGGTPGDAASALVREFEVTEAEALESTLDLCGDLVEAGLLVPVEAR